MPITKLNEKVRTAYLVTGSVIKRDNKYLLVREKKPEVYGKWNLPAGKAEVGLTLEENATKETREETGFEVKIIREIGIYHQEGDKSVKHAYEAKIVGGKLEIPEDEILDAKWFDFDEIQMLDKQGLIRNSWVVEAVKVLNK